METLKFDDTELDENSLKLVREEVNENDEKRKICLKTLKKKLQDTEHLNPNLNDDYLLAFLRVAKFDCSKAYKRIMSYYEEKRNATEISKDYYPSSVKIVETARKLMVCPYRAKDNSAIVIVKKYDYDISKMPYELILRFVSMSMDLLILHPLNQMCGFTFIVDPGPSSWNSLSEWTPARLKLIARVAQKSFPARIRAVHIVNAPPLYYILYSIVYPFLSVKLRNRIHIHKDYASLHSFVDPENLPKEYDGCLEQSDLINMQDRINAKEEYFRNYVKYGFMKKK